MFISTVHYYFQHKEADARHVEELKESESRFHSAFSHAAIGMALCSPNGRWLQVNQALCELIGYSREELLDMSFQDITHPDDLELDLDNVRRLYAGEIASYQMEKRYRHRNGSTVWVLLTGAVVRNAQGTPVYAIGQMQDITDVKHREQQRSELHARHPLSRPLSNREREILALTADGLTSEQIAARLAIAAETVQTHVRRAMRKLDASSRTQAVATAIKLGLI